MSSSTIETGSDDYSVVNLAIRPLYSDVEISSLSANPLEEHSNKFNLDVSGPRVLFCADRFIDLLIKSAASQYVEFKSVDASFVGDESGKLWNVPDSRAAIFKDKSLSLMEKNRLMRFFKLVQGQLAASSGRDGENGNQGEEVESETAGISEEDLESPFVDFLTNMKLPSKIKSYRLLHLYLSVSESSFSSCCLFHLILFPNAQRILVKIAVFLTSIFGLFLEFSIVISLFDENFTNTFQS